MNYKKISFKEALVLHTEGKDVYYTYHTSPDTYRYIGSLGLDHARRNTSWYLYFIEDLIPLRQKLLFSDTLEDCRGDEVTCKVNNPIYREEDVKEAVNLFKDYCENMINKINPDGIRTDLTTVAKDVFGKNLINQDGAD